MDWVECAPLASVVLATGVATASGVFEASASVDFTFWALGVGFGGAVSVGAAVVVYWSP